MTSGKKNKKQTFAPAGRVNNSRRIRSSASRSRLLSPACLLVHSDPGFGPSEVDGKRTRSIMAEEKKSPPGRFCLFVSVALLLVSQSPISGERQPLVCLISRVSPFKLPDVSKKKRFERSHCSCLVTLP